MSRPIVVGYDPRGVDHAPVYFGVAAARFTGAPLVVASVEAGERHLAIPAHHTDEDLVPDCGEALAAIDAELRSAGVAVECRSLGSTSAARALHDLAEEVAAGLLVVGSSRRSAVGSVLLGSTAERLMHGAPCPVAVVPQGWAGDGGPSTIGAAYVDSAEGREALRGAHALARRAGAKLRAVTVVKLGLGMHLQTEAGTAGRFGKDLEDVEGEHRLRAEQELRSALAELDGGVSTEVDASVGDPAETLIRVSEHVDLLVCGARGFGPLRAVLLGSVSRRVTSEARCPVIVLPRGVEAALEALVAEAPGAAA